MQTPAHGRRKPSPGSRADRRAPASCGYGRGERARPSRSSSPRPSQRTRGSNRTGRPPLAQTTAAHRGSPSRSRAPGSKPGRSGEPRHKRPHSKRTQLLEDPKIGPWRERLDSLLLKNDGKPARARLTLIRDVQPQPLITELCRLRPDDLPNHFAGNTQISADRLGDTTSISNSAP